MGDKKGLLIFGLGFGYCLVYLMEFNPVFFISGLVIVTEYPVSFF